MDGEVRVFSELTAIRASCRDILLINEPFLMKIIDGVLEKAWARYGQNPFGEAVEVEMARRKTEVAATGAKRWCTYQRGYVKSRGLGAIFGD